MLDFGEEQSWTTSPHSKSSECETWKTNLPRPRLFISCFVHFFIHCSSVLCSLFERTRSTFQPLFDDVESISTECTSNPNNLQWQSLLSRWRGSPWAPLYSNKRDKRCVDAPQWGAEITYDQCTSPTRRPTTNSEQGATDDLGEFKVHARSSIERCSRLNSSLRIFSKSVHSLASLDASFLHAWLPCDTVGWSECREIAHTWHGCSRCCTCLRVFLKILLSILFEMVTSMTYMTW